MCRLKKSCVELRLLLIINMMVLLHEQKLRAEKAAVFSVSENVTAVSLAGIDAKNHTYAVLGICSLF